MADLGNYRIVLREGFPQCQQVNGEFFQTWSYLVTLIGETPPGEEISNWALELCAPEHVVVSSDPEGEVSDNPEPCLELVEGVERQIKWDGLNDEFIGEGRIFTFTLEGCFEPAQVFVAVKTGGEPVISQGCKVGTITGPSCEEENGNGNGNGRRRGVTL